MKGRKDDSNIVKDGDDSILKHGTPHDFTKFQLEKIGTGEGAQAFGYGLYFTEVIQQLQQELHEESNHETIQQYSHLLKKLLKIHC